MPTKEVKTSSDRIVQDQIRASGEKVESALKSDLLLYIGPIAEPADQLIRQALELTRIMWGADLERGPLLS